MVSEGYFYGIYIEEEIMKWIHFFMIFLAYTYIKLVRFFVFLSRKYKYKY